jgi:hypothetical protein
MVIGNVDFRLAKFTHSLAQYALAWAPKKSTFARQSTHSPGAGGGIANRGNEIAATRSAVPVLRIHHVTVHQVT